MEWLTDHFHRLRGLLRRRGRTREETEDCIQEAYLKVIHYLQQGGEIKEPEAFLVRSVLNLARDLREREHAELYVAQPVEELDLVDFSAGPDDLLVAEQCADRLIKAWDSLGPRTQQVYYLHRVNGIPYAQIARTLRISVSAVEKAIARALTTLGKEARRE